MKPSLNLLKEEFLKTFPPYQVIHKEQQEAFIDQALQINSLISVKLAKCKQIKIHLLKRALSLIDRLDAFLESLENTNKFYCYYYHVLLEIIENCELGEHDPI